jgi:predicted acyl esterase
MRSTLLILLAAISCCDSAIVDLNLMLPMRDGVKLHTRILSTGEKTEKMPTIIDRSPYGATGTELIADIYDALGKFVAVGQDMRGTQASEGNFTMWRSDAIDAYDTMEWITNQSWSDGTIYTVGGSADGITQFVDVLQQPPWLKGQFIIWATIDALTTVYPGGAYREGLISRWMKSTVPKQAVEKIAEVKQHNGAGTWWDPLNVSSPNAYGDIHAPAVMWAGWYDIFLQGNLNGYYIYQHLADEKIRGKSYLMVDPFGHCQVS